MRVKNDGLLAKSSYFLSFQFGLWWAVQLTVWLATPTCTAFTDLPCPSICTQEEPVCGSDGIIYKSGCHLRKQNCGLNISESSWSNCRAESGSNCSHKCDQDFDLVCGTDGRTYINQCFLKVEGCLRDVEIAHFGQCANDKPKIGCPSSCAGADRDGPVCASDGNVYKNSCEMQKSTCGQSVVRVDNRHCKTTKHCQDKCFKISKISCGSDGKMYNNGCQMKRKNCGKHIYEVPIGFCLNRLYRAKCPIDCSQHKKKPICGSNGQLYASECELQKANCGFPLITFKKITKVALKRCVEKISVCKKMTCPDEVDEVCGDDATTYRNLCELQEATCRAGVQVAHPGPCLDLSKQSSCPTDCPNSNATEVVCGSDGNVYKSQCELQRQTCGERVGVAAHSHCQTTSYCSADCSGERNDYVCGSDGQLYQNICHMRKSNCGRHIYRVPVTVCLSVFQWRGCARVCPPSLDPVCGTDGKTYLNPCFIQQESCRARSLGEGVRLDYYGRCGEPRQKPKLFPIFTQFQPV